MTDYTSDDIKNICTFKTSLSPEIIDKVVQVAELLNNAVNKEKLFGARGSPWQFNLRDLMRFSKGVADSGNNLIFRYLKLVFIERFRLEQDRQGAAELIQSIFGDFNEELMDTPKTLDIDENSLKIGCAELPRVNSYHVVENIEFKLEDYPILESLSLCIKNEWLSIIVGDGKNQDLSRYVQLLAGLLGQKLHCLTLSSATDTSELLGGFEQTSNDIVISSLKNQMFDIVEENLLENPENQLSFIKLKIALMQAENIEDLKELFLTFSEKLVKNEKFQVIMSKLEQLSKDVTFDWIDSVLIKVNTLQFSFVINSNRPHTLLSPYLNHKVRT